jgi:YHS domain-containing protein
MYGLFALIRNLLLLVVVITVLRSVIGVVMKLFAGFVGTSKASQPAQAGSRKPEIPLSGDFHRDPVCGTFVAGTTTFQRQLGGQRFYYCSEACRSQHELAVR